MPGREGTEMTGMMMPENELRVYRNGRILTVDSRFSICSALATMGSRIVATGSDEELGVLARKASQVVDVAGRTVVPGLIGTHGHMDRGGLEDRYPRPEGARSRGD